METEAIFEGSCDRGNENQAEVCGLLPVCIRREITKIDLTE